MVRFAFLIFLVGGGLTFYGYQEYQVGSGASGTPVPCELNQIEATGEGCDGNMTVGQHFALYHETLIWGEEDSDDVDYALYPIVSQENPYNQAWLALDQKYPDGNVPPAEQPQLTQLAVIVKTHRFDTIDDIPGGWGEEAGVTGLLVHDIDPLPSDAVRLLRESFPQADMDGILVLEEDRNPSSLLFSLGLMVAGVVAMLGAIALFFRGLFS